MQTLECFCGICKKHHSFIFFSQVRKLSTSTHIQNYNHLHTRVMHFFCILNILFEYILYRRSYGALKGLECPRIPLRYPSLQKMAKDLISNRSHKWYRSPNVFYLYQCRTPGWDTCSSFSPKECVSAMLNDKTRITLSTIMEVAIALCSFSSSLSSWFSDMHQNINVPCISYWLQAVFLMVRHFVQNINFPNMFLWSLFWKRNIIQKQRW